MLPPGARRFLFPAVLILCGAAFLCGAALVIDQITADERDAMLEDLHSRAQSLAWTIEGAGRFLENRETSLLAPLLTEIGRQPGIAWLALVADSGTILLDSNPELAGELLYTPAELRAMHPDSTLKGRFSPDDPNIYEAWKTYSPERLWPKRHKKTSAQPRILFIAIDAAGFYASLESRKTSLWLLALALLAFGASSAALVHYLRRYYLSRASLRDAKALAQQVISNFPGALIVTDENGRPDLFNEKARQFLPPAPNAASLQAIDWSSLQKEISGSGAILERELALPPNGAPVSLTATAMTDGLGRPSGYLIIMRDLAQIRILERKLAESRRLSALGHMASGLAHEIRNPLSSICGYACYLGKRLAGDPMGKATATLLEEEARRLNNILTDLLQLAKPPALNFRKVAIGQLLKKAATIARPDAEAKQIVLTENYGSGPEVRADPERMLQAILNLVLNAIQAAPENGRVAISSLWLERGQLPESLSHCKGAWRIEVSDTGPGISAAMRDKIFTPYFTTRASGTGLGLPLSRQIAEAHNGCLDLASQPGSGATFAIFLPAEHP